MKNTTAIFLLILTLGLFYVLTRPTYWQVKELRAVAGEYQNVLENLSQIGETRDRLLLDYEEIPKAEVERLKKVLPDNIDTVRLALELDTIASRYGIAIKNIRVDTVATQNASTIILPEYAKPYEKATVVFTLVSNYANFRKFLEDLEKSLRIMDVRAIEFQVGEAGFYEHKLSVETYWLK